MKKTRKHLWQISLLMFLSLSISVGCFAAAEENIHKDFKVDFGGVLMVDSDLGSIDVETTGSKKVDIEIAFRSRSGGSRRLKEILQDIDVDIQQHGDDVDVIIEYEHGSRNFWNSITKNVKVRIRARVPEKYNVDLKTSGGSIEVQDLEGFVKSRTSGGSLKFGNITGDVDGKTSGGSIKLSGCEGDAKVTTSGGRIDIGRVKGDVDAHTSGGGIRVEEVSGDIKATTSGGSVEAAITEQPKDQCKLTTSGGSISVYLKSDVQMDVSARTSGGHVSTDFPVMVQGKLNKHSLEAEINGGGPLLYLRTSGGSIHIREM